MPYSKLSNFVLLPKLSLLEIKQDLSQTTFRCETKTQSIWCQHCGLECFKVHDKRIVRVNDAPNLNQLKTFLIIKKRFSYCRCKKVITENIPGIRKGARVTERMQKHLLYICHHFASMKSARRHLKL